METTRKLDVEDLLLLKELQMHLLRRGIKTTQKSLFSEMLEFVTKKRSEFVNFFAKRETVEKDSIDVLLTKTFTGKDRTNAALEHDLIT